MTFTEILFFVVGPWLLMFGIFVFLYMHFATDENIEKVFSKIDKIFGGKNEDV